MAANLEERSAEYLSLLDSNDLTAANQVKELILEHLKGIIFASNFVYVAQDVFGQMLSNLTSPNSEKWTDFVEHKLLLFSSRSIWWIFIILNACTCYI